MKEKIALFALLLAAFAVTGCAGNTGTLVMQITDAPADLDISEAKVTISNVEVHKAAAGAGENATMEAGWHTVVGEAKTFDLVAIKDVKEFLGSAELEAGKYTQIRLSVDNAIAVIDGSNYELEVPSDSVKLVSNFDIAAGQETILTLDFDAMESIHESGKGYSLRPTIKVIQE